MAGKTAYTQTEAARALDYAKFVFAVTVRYDLKPDSDNTMPASDDAYLKQVVKQARKENYTDFGRGFYQVEQCLDRNYPGAPTGLILDTIDALRKAVTAA
jgi:hypothetical protein